MVLDDVKTILDITDTSMDNKITLYIRRADNLILLYLNDSTITDTTMIETNYPDAVVQFVIECMNRRGNEGITQYSQGSRSGTYGNSDILSNDVKALLPLPKVGLVNTRRCYNDN